jgi:hypothetical protein
MGEERREHARWETNAKAWHGRHTQPGLASLLPHERHHINAGRRADTASPGAGYEVASLLSMRDIVRVA